MKFDPNDAMWSFPQTAGRIADRAWASVEALPRADIRGPLCTVLVRWLFAQGAFADAQRYAQKLDGLEASGAREACSVRLLVLAGIRGGEWGRSASEAIWRQTVWPFWETWVEFLDVLRIHGADAELALGSEELAKILARLGAKGAPPLAANVRGRLIRVLISILAKDMQRTDARALLKRLLGDDDDARFRTAVPLACMGLSGTAISLVRDVGQDAVLTAHDFETALNFRDWSRFRGIAERFFVSDAPAMGLRSVVDLLEARCLVPSPAQEFSGDPFPRAVLEGTWWEYGFVDDAERRRCAEHRMFQYAQAGDHRRASVAFWLSGRDRADFCAQIAKLFLTQGLALEADAWWQAAVRIEARLRSAGIQTDPIDQRFLLRRAMFALRSGDLRDAVPAMGDVMRSLSLLWELDQEGTVDVLVAAYGPGPARRHLEGIGICASVDGALAGCIASALAEFEAPDVPEDLRAEIRTLVESTSRD